MRALQSNEKLRAVLFDWDGTLLDSYHASAQAYLAMFRAMQIDWDLGDLARHYAPDWYAVYRAAGLPRKCWAEADRLWRLHFLKLKSMLVPGARRVLRRLRENHRLGLVTSGDRLRVIRQLREFRLTRLFAVRVYGGDTRQRKPHPAPLELALAKMRLKPTECLFVGDSPEDLEMARRAGVRAIAVLGPFPTEKGLRTARPELLLESIAQLPRALRSFGN